MTPDGAIPRHEIRATWPARCNQRKICGKQKGGKDVVDAKITFYLKKHSISWYLTSRMARGVVVLPFSLCCGDGFSESVNSLIPDDFVANRKFSAVCAWRAMMESKLTTDLAAFFACPGPAAMLWI
jgi:hypothetical protein